MNNYSFYFFFLLLLFFLFISYRQDSMTSKIIGSYSSIIGRNYLFEILGPVLKEVLKLDLSCEVDTLKILSEQNLETNQNNLRELSQKVFDSIISSYENIPQ